MATKGLNIDISEPRPNFLPMVSSYWLTMSNVREFNKILKNDPSEWVIMMHFTTFIRQILEQERE